MNTVTIGNFGEEAATRYLEKNGYSIVARNYKPKIAEIDIIAYNKEGVLCFVEVKTRKTSLFGYACEAVDFKKQKKITQGALSYIRSHNIDSEIRFDVIEVYGKVQSDGFSISKINHIKNAF